LNLSENTLRFSQLRKEVPSATPKMLTQQLRELEADKLVRREVFPVIPPKVEYSLTEFGREHQAGA
jgi:DNA-binding HxlR family transcriptional regulator